MAPWFWRMAVSVCTRGGFCRFCARDRDNGRNSFHAGERIGDVGLLRQGGLGQENVDAVADVAAVNARVFSERGQILRLPDRAGEVLAENFEINLRRTTEA